MTKSFLKFKSRMRRAQIAKSAVLSASCGVFAAALLTVILKICAVYPKVWILLPVGIITAAAAFAISFRALSIKDSALAKKIDKDLELSEKTQTMIEFAECPGDMIALQREDSEKQLSAYPTEAIAYGSVWKNIIMPIVAALTVIAAIVVPQKIPQGEIDPDFRLTMWQEIKLKEVISDVKNSAMAEEPRDAAVTELETLLSTLKHEVKKESRMKAEVIQAIVDIREITKAANTNTEIGKALRDSESEMIARLGSSVYSISATETQQTLEDMRTSVTDDNYSELLSLYAECIISPLGELDIDKDDALYKAVSEFASSIETLADVNLIPSIFNRAVADVRCALITQYTNNKTTSEAINELLYIFCIDPSEVPKDEDADDSDDGDGSDGEDEGGENKDEDDLSSGGYGTGEVVYGSDDLIYSPEDNDYVVYGTVLDNYFKKFTEWVIDNEVSEELEKFVNDYFTSLYGGIDEEK